MSSHEFAQTLLRGTNVEGNAQRSAHHRFVARVHNKESRIDEFLGSLDKTLCFPNQRHEPRPLRQMSELPDIAAARRLVDANVAGLDEQKSRRNSQRGSVTDKYCPPRKLGTLPGFAFASERAVSMTLSDASIPIVEAGSTLNARPTVIDPGPQPTSSKRIPGLR